MHRVGFSKSLIAMHFAAALLLAGLTVTSARADDTPPTIAGAKLVAAQDVMKASATGAVVIIDTRVASEYSEGHIKGAISVPYREKSAKSVDFDANQDQFDLSKLPSDKAAAIVVYCNGPECWKSYKASMVAAKRGYSNILWYRLGYPDWKSKGLATE